jgi:hypothetical protein
VPSTWTEIEAETERLFDKHSEVFAPQTIANTRVFVTFAAGRYKVPDEVVKGKWLTISMSWVLQPYSVEVEIHERQFEFYTFRDRKTDISEVPRSTDNVFPDALRALLDPVLSLSAAEI